VELPPTPKKVRSEKTGRPVEAGSRVKLAGTCDVELARLFHEWRIARGLDLSRGLDVVLWNFLGEPRLSFEWDE